ncbi:ankyrin repeat-containing protein NPR4-like isoform X1 [Rosa rugosa]|uniref:ankyrin repeat-containing protein NPR4-like isoform X1 n=1 Tax=Rosa rugosa TaxID=74645 RepID=UPI002B40C30D|nr:ankyrin repeat-containing protein NPR4-like isoform X1 [Rosa rugosa]
MSEKLTTSSPFEVEEGVSTQENFPKESAGEVMQETCGLTFGGDNGTAATSGRQSFATSDGGYSAGPPSSRMTCATISYGGYYSSGGTSSCRPTCHPLPPGLGTPIIAIVHSPEFTFGGWGNSTENVDVEIGHDQQPDDLEATYTAEEAERKQREDAASPVITHSDSISICWPLRKLLDRGRNESHSNNDHETSIAGPPSEHVPNNVANSSNIISSVINSDLVPHVPLHLAALKGDWNTAKSILQSKPGAVRARITKGSETALHIAAGAKHTSFVEELVKWMTAEDLELKNDVENTALFFAAVSGIKRIAEVMVEVNPILPRIRGSNNSTALHMATLLGHREMVRYLYSKTKRILTYQDRVGLLIAAITADLYDVALDIVKQHPEMALARDENEETALHVMARKPSAYHNGSQLGFWKRCILSFPRDFKRSCEEKVKHALATELVKQLWKKILTLENDSKIGDLIRKPSRLLFTAAELGNLDFLIILMRSYPNLIWKVDEQNRSIFHIAVVHRQEKVFNLIYELGGLKDLIASYKDDNNNNMLHLAAKLAPANRLNTDTGAAFQLRRELLWFKEVEKIVQPLYKEMRNSDGKTPQILFTEEHRELLKEGEKWMKGTASSCMVVATLIATVMFAVFSTVPGGNNNDTGMPMFIKETAFKIFAISDAVSLVSSATSILSFLSILTSRYTEGDFLHSLPNRLIVGLATLFISIGTMMLTYVATLFIVLGSGNEGIKVPITLVAVIPVSFYALLQFPLLSDMISHAYISRVSFRSSNHLLQ